MNDLERSNAEAPETGSNPVHMEATIQAGITVGYEDPNNNEPDMWYKMGILFLDPRVTHQNEIWEYHLERREEGTEMVAQVTVKGVYINIWYRKIETS